MTGRRSCAAAHLDFERGTIRKDWGGRLPIALVFPNTYHVGMSSLAVHALYGLWNARDDIVCERAFTDTQPLASLESGSPLSHFPVVAFSISYELDYFRVVPLLRSAGITPLASKRDDTEPLVIAGGPAVSANPEPVAPFFDAILIGEIEPVFGPLTDALAQSPEGRSRVLAALAQVPGIYLPNATPSPPTTPVERQVLHDLDSFPTHSVIVTPRTEFPDMALIEIARGCGRGCRFCLTTYAYRPARERTVSSLLSQARRLMGQTDRLGLVSAAVSDHSEIDRLVMELRRLGARLSVSSLRVDPLSEALVRALAESRARTLTIAPEAGSERLRRLINKSQSQDDVLHAVELADRYGLSQLKLYFMLGLPTEDQADVQALIDLAMACAARFSRNVTVNITPFVPKAHTGFQRCEQMPEAEVRRRLSYVERSLRARGIQVKSESPAWAEVQGTLARGDRRLSEALLAIEHPSPAAWRRCLQELGVSIPGLLSSRPPGSPLPWSFIRFSAARLDS